MNLKLAISSIIILSCVKIAAVFLTSFNLFGDEAQYWIWSKALDFGYLSKPPLIAWAIYIYTYIFGNSFISLKLFSIVFYFFSAAALYVFCKKINFSKTESIFCSLSFLIMPAVSFSSFLISTDVLLIFFWILSMIGFLNVLKKQNVMNFLILGIFLGLAFLAKYAAIYFFISFFTLIIFDKQTRDILYLNKYKFLFFLISFLIVILPNLIWNFNNGWLTFSHTSNNANLKNINLNFLQGLFFLILQIIMIGPFLFLGFLFNFKKITYNKEGVFLLCFSIPIILIVLTESILVRANANWAAVSLVCLLIFFFKSTEKLKSLFLSLNFFVNFVFGLILFILIATSSNIKIFDRINGIGHFAEELKNDLGATRNLVISDRLLYSSISYEYRDDNIEFYMPLSPNETITKHFQIYSSLSANMSEVFLFIGDPSEISYLKNESSFKLLRSVNTKFSSSTINIYEVSF